MRVTVQDIISSTEGGLHAHDGTPIDSAEDYENWLKKKGIRMPTKESSDAADLVAAAGRTPVVDAETLDPNNNNQMSVEEYEAAARALADANQNAEAITSWHRAAIAHSKVGNHAGVVASIVRAEHLANHLNFAPSLARKSTTADFALAGEAFDGIADERRAGATTTNFDGIPATCKPKKPGERQVERTDDEPAGTFIESFDGERPQLEPGTGRPW